MEKLRTVVVLQREGETRLGCQMCMFIQRVQLIRLNELSNFSVGLQLQIINFDTCSRFI